MNSMQEHRLMLCLGLSRKTLGLGRYSSISDDFIIIIIDNRGLNTRWCLTPLLLSLPTVAYLGQR